MDRIELREYAFGAPALSTIDGVPAIAWTGTDQPSHLNVASGGDLGRLAKVTLFDETSRVGPALAANGSSSFLAWTGTDNPGHLNVASSPDAWSGYAKHTAGVETSRLGPALACGDGWLFLAWTGGDSRLTVAASNDGGGSFPYMMTLDERSGAGPSLAFHDGTLYLLWAGTDLRLNVASTRDLQGLTLGAKVTLDERSRFAPAMTMTDRWLLVWTRMDARLGAMESVDARMFSGLQMLDETAIAGPALAVWQDVPVVAWTGTDRQLTLASLTEAPLPTNAGVGYVT